MKEPPQLVEELTLMVETSHKVEVDAFSPLGRSFLSNVLNESLRAEANRK
ncbi:hypothetical protein ACE6H2_014006 [Prunus campanulata]